MAIARIIVDVPARALSEPFDYDVPEGMDGVLIGAPVLVPFGPRPVVGYVVGLTDTSAVAERKPIAEVLGAPLFTESAFPLADWIAARYVCALAEAMRLFLPPGGSPKVVRVPTEDGSPAGHRLVAAAAGPVDDRWAELSSAAEFAPRAGATAQRAVLDALSDGPVRVSELVAALGSVDGALRRLEAVGAVLVTRRRRMRVPHTTSRPAPRPDTLTDGQSDALLAIERAEAGAAVLLDGVTGSGKTEVYLQAIERVVGQGGRAIVLVPEISLTPQTFGRFRARFGDAVAVLHSRLAVGERYDQWDRVRAGEASVVVGPRSALFAPVRDLRLVVVDEEHESSYKQGSAPRYHARDVARRLCEATGAVLVLGSATPSLESLAAVEAGRSTLVRLPERATGGPLPPVSVVDMTAEFADGHRSMFSRLLTEELRRVRETGSKAVLLMNRRGFAAFVLCRECGHVPRCSECSVSLTYHEVGSSLVCHQCGATVPLPPTCPRCSSPYLRQFGAGTQRVEAELAAEFPDLPVVRMDMDTTRSKGGHERRLVEFETLQSGVLLGTQMIAKGLDYPDVTLAGVINADTTLHLPDFRSTERTFQLLEQVAGRAGRGPRGGTVVIQTYWPDNPAIVAASTHDPSRMYDEERELRRTLGYPPYGALANVTLTGLSADDVRLSATATADALRAVAPTGWQVLGPSPAVIARVRGSYRWHVMLKAPADADLSTALGDVLARTRRPPGVSVAPDIDPFDLM
jgi:primosomal protein N' (replication factor Y)